jgi:hypothetical protein
MARSFPQEEGGSAIGVLITDGCHGLDGDEINVSRFVGIFRWAGTNFRHFAKLYAVIFEGVLLPRQSRAICQR